MTSSVSKRLTNLRISVFLNVSLVSLKIVYRDFQKSVIQQNGNGSITMRLMMIYVCMNAIKKNKMPSSGNTDQAFISRGYSNWKDATGEKGAFNNHQHSTK